MTEEYSPQKHEFGTDAAAEWAKAITPGQGRKEKKKMKEFFEYCDMLDEKVTHNNFSFKKVKYSATPARPAKRVSAVTSAVISSLRGWNSKAAAMKNKELFKKAKKVHKATLFNMEEEILYVRELRWKGEYLYLLSFDNELPYLASTSKKKIPQKDYMYFGDEYEYATYFKFNKKYVGDEYEDEEDEGHPDFPRGAPPEYSSKDTKTINMLLNVEYEENDAGSVALDGEISDSLLSFKDLQSAYSTATEWVGHRFIYIGPDMKDELVKWYEKNDKKGVVNRDDLDEMLEEMDWKSFEGTAEDDGEWMDTFTQAARESMFKHSDPLDYLAGVGSYKAQYHQDGWTISFAYLPQGKGNTHLYLEVNDHDRTEPSGYVRMKNPQNLDVKRTGLVIERLLFENRIKWWPEL